MFTDCLEVFSLEQTFRIGISGSYGGMNLGDEAILQSIIAQLRASLSVEITVFSRNAEDTKQRHKVERVIQVRDLTRVEVRPEIQRLDLLILGGGGILFDTEAEIFLREIEIANEEGVPTMVYAVSVGPLSNENTKKRIKKVLSTVNIITVREREAKKALEEIGVDQDIIVTADPAFLLEPEPLPKDIIEQKPVCEKPRLIGISVREPGPAAPNLDPSFYHNLIANAADFVINRLDSSVVFVPMERQVLDVQNSHAVLSKMFRPQCAWVLKGEYTPGQLLTFMKKFDFVIGMRLHFLIFAALQGIPFVALPYASKVSGLLDELKAPMPPLNQVNAGLLISYIDQAWDERNKTISQIQQHIIEQKKRAQENNRLAVELLTSSRSNRTKLNIK